MESLYDQFGALDDGQTQSIKDDVVVPGIARVLEKMVLDEVGSLTINGAHLTSRFALRDAALAAASRPASSKLLFVRLTRLESEAAPPLGLVRQAGG